jgi:Asp-tRNA(Asn)/Glu-tRNA(Gln) amidotransferase C subunit
MTTGTPITARRFLLLVYRMPANPTAGRVAVWRNLKKIGAVYLQDSACVIPDTAALRRELSPILERIDAAEGRYHLLPLRKLPLDEEQKLVSLFVEQTADHYREIIENCEVNFAKEIEFEHFRKNFTYEEAEEIRMDFEKICTWFERVQERDWFGAPNHDEARDWLRRSEELLEGFEEKVFEVNATDQAPPASSK